MLNNIVDNLEQCGQQNIVNAVFIRPEQVVHFLLCSAVNSINTGTITPDKNPTFE